MAIHYCSSCGSKVTYETAKPAKCPKCARPIKDAVAILNKAIQAAAPVADDPYEGSDMDEGLTPQSVRASDQDLDDLGLPPARSARSQPVKRKTRQRPTFASTRNVIKVDGEDDEGEEDEGGHEAYDPNRLAMLRRKMIQAYAGVADDIQIGSPVQGENMTFKQLHDQAKQEQG